MTGMPKRHPKPKAGSGLDEQGNWTPQFPGQRPPFPAGHELSVTWGDRAMLKLRPRAAEIAEQIRGLIPLWNDSFGPVVELASMVLAQAEAAFAGLADDPDLEKARWLDERASRSSKQAGQYLDRLGLTPMAQAKLGVNLSQVARSEQLRRHLEENYGGEKTSARDVSPSIDLKAGFEPSYVVEQDEDAA
jgi:hypothetical protein